jgi:hypothetical protein
MEQNILIAILLGYSIGAGIGIYINWRNSKRPTSKELIENYMSAKYGSDWLDQICDVNKKNN